MIEFHVRFGRFEKMAVKRWCSDANWKVQFLTAGAEVCAGNWKVCTSPEAIHLAN